MSVGVILVVEDEPLIRLDVESALEEAGFEVVGVSNASQAIAAFDLEAEKVRGLITDIRLGPGQSGWDVARHLRQANSALPVVYMSGDSAIHWGAEGVPNSVMKALCLGTSDNRPHHSAESAATGRATR